MPFSDTATTLGAAILAGVGVGIYDSFETPVSHIKITRNHNPNMENHEKYESFFETYLALYENLKTLMKK